MKAPDDVQALLKRRFASKQREWLRFDHAPDSWPLDVPLSIPSEAQAHRDVEKVRAWARAWHAWPGPGKVVWTERHWRDLGVQKLPERILLSDATEVASWVGEGKRWARACDRYSELTSAWPILKEALPQHFDVLADYADIDFRRLADMLGWLSAHPSSGLYPRQLPIAGMDSKWIEARRGLITSLVRTLRPEIAPTADFYAACGLRPLPSAVRLRVLDPILRSRVGGLSDLMGGPDELARVPISPKRVFIVENLQSGLALPDLEGCVAFMALGYSTELIASITWIRDGECVYWGDCDTHGLAILSKVRDQLPATRSIMMDEETLLSHKALWSVEAKQHTAPYLPNLQPDEAALYAALKHNRWQDRIRLEQERIGWDYVLKRIRT